MELKEIEEATEETQGRFQEMEHEVAAHQERAEQLEAAMAELYASMEELGSEGAEGAMAAAEGARAETEERLEELREEREELLSRNEEMTEQVQAAHEQRGRAMEKVGLIESLSYGAEGEIVSQVRLMRESLRQDLGRLGSAEERLRAVRLRLEGLEI